MLVGVAAQWKGTNSFLPTTKPAELWPGAQLGSSRFWLKDCASCTLATLLLSLVEKMTKEWFLVQQMEGALFLLGFPYSGSAEMLSSGPGELQRIP